MGKPFRIGLAWQMDRRYGEEAIRGIAEYSKRYGPWLFFMNHIQDFDIRRLGRRGEFDGIVVGYDDLARARAVNWSPDVPRVSVHMMFSTVAPWQIHPDNVAVGRMAAKEFIRLGLRHFAFCPHAEMAQQPIGGDFGRLQGFTAALAEIGGKAIVYEGPLGGWGRIQPRRHSVPLKRWLAALPKPVGILAASDMRARHLLLAAEAAEVRVPEDVAVIGVNNEAWAEILFRGLSSIELDAYRAGYAAADVLHRLMCGEAAEPGATLIPPRRLVVRRSSSTRMIHDADVAAAVLFIAERATSGIDVEQVVDAVPLSRRSLERRFQEMLGHSILHEIHLVRVERAKLLLADPDITLTRVAKVAGFGSLKSMRVIFKRLTGSSPATYCKHMAIARE